MMELLSALAAYNVDHQVIMQMPGIHVRGDYHLEVGKLFLCERNAEGIDLLRCQAVFVREGLHEVIELSVFGANSRERNDHLLKVTNFGVK